MLFWGLSQCSCVLPFFILFPLDLDPLLLWALPVIHSLQSTSKCTQFSQFSRSVPAPEWDWFSAQDLLDSDQPTLVEKPTIKALPYKSALVFYFPKTFYSFCLKKIKIISLLIVLHTAILTPHSRIMGSWLVICCPCPIYRILPIFLNCICVFLACVFSLHLSPAHQGGMERREETKCGERKQGNTVEFKRWDVL